MGGHGSGRKRQPTSLAQVRGTHPRYINDQEPKPSDNLPVEPTGPLSPGANQAWVRLVPELITTGVATGWDVTALMEMCECIATLEEARAALLDEGRTVVEMRANGGDIVKVNPWWTIYCGAQKQFLQWSARFGLTPSDRASLVVGGEKQEPGQDLLSGSG